MMQVRHGESVDNLVLGMPLVFWADISPLFPVNQKDIWAGPKDAPLSNHGTVQVTQKQLRLTSIASTDVDAVTKNPISDVTRNERTHTIPILKFITR